MNNLFWKIVAWIVTRPAIRRALIARAERTPYEHIRSQDGRSVYMYRYWLFNPYPFSNARLRKWPRVPVSIRLHVIQRPDQDRHLHDHPWDARTIILAGGYAERRANAEVVQRREGDTATLKHGEYHRIVRVNGASAVTLFFTYRYRGTWGFLVNGKKVPWREYLGVSQ